MSSETNFPYVKHIRVVFPRLWKLKSYSKTTLQKKNSLIMEATEVMTGRNRLYLSFSFFFLFLSLKPKQRFWYIFSFVFFRSKKGIVHCLTEVMTGRKVRAN